jgi:hypothetical protein
MAAWPSLEKLAIESVWKIEESFIVRRRLCGQGGR